MNRRAFLGSLAAGFAEPVSKAHVSSDVATLKRVLVHSPGPETRTGLGLGYGPPRILGYAGSDHTTDEHAAMVALLRKGGTEVLELEAVLNDAVRESRKAGRLATWLRGWAPQLAPRAAELDASVLLGYSAEYLYRNDADGAFHPLVDPAASFYWLRDSAFMTPRGVALCAFSHDGRLVESTLMRFAYEWAPALSRYRIVFDAAEEQTAVEGGDVMVADERTLWIGTGNRSKETAARRLAQRLDMNVLAIQMPSLVTPAMRTAIHSVFLHLDTICTLVDRKAVVTVPYFLESAWAGKDPLTHMLRGLARGARSNEPDLNRMADLLKDFGRVRRYKAGSGELDSSLKDVKFVDYLRAEGYQIIFAGGSVPEKNVEQHVAERVLKEVRAQACNVLAVAPKKVIAYTGNAGTQAALEKSGIEVMTFPGVEIMRNGGGPHCLTQPLERA